MIPLQTPLKVRASNLPLPNQTSIVVQKGHEYCLVNQDGSYYAIDNLCPHKMASLGLGELKEDEILCPLHEFRFNFKTGKCNISPYDVTCYEVQIVN